MDIGAALTPSQAKALIVSILDSTDGEIAFSGHALKEMENDGITVADVLLVLRGGVVEPAEFENGSWRYRVRARNVFAVATFRAVDRAVVVTAWRKK